MTTKYVVYKRVSTKGQGENGHGLDAQQRDIELFLSTHAPTPCEVIEELIEIRSGGDTERPVLMKAIELAKRQKAILLVSKLDRLSRKVSQIAQLMEDKHLELKICAMPRADKFQLHIYAALAEQEREFISMRTKSGLAAAKAKGVKLGGLRDKTNARNQAKRKEADAFASFMWEAIEPMFNSGMNYSQIATRLNNLNMKTTTGKCFVSQTVKNIALRMKAQV